MPEPIDALAVTAGSTLPEQASASSGLLRQLGRYRVERELGAGGMGVVYAAHDPELDRRVALKVLRNVDEESRARLRREARAMARLSHPNVVTVYEVGTADDRDYIAMELVDGTSLAEWLHASDRSMAERVDALLAAGRGLAAAHAAGMVHRDFKPHNVLRARDGRVLVTDFGLAVSPMGSQERGAAPAGGGPGPLAQVTWTGALAGTPAYMAPEQWRGAAVTAAADQFAFCVSLWEAIARRRPFTGTTLDELRGQIERGLTSPQLATLPRGLRPIVARGLHPDPTRRWPGMAELLQAIGRTRRVRRWRPVVAGATVVALSLGGWLAYRDARPQESPRAASDELLQVLSSGAEARFVPVLGPSRGFKLYAIRSGSYLAAIGLRNGDVLTAIDGIPIGPEDNLREVVQRLATRRAHRLDIVRAGTRLSLDATAR